MADQDVHNFSSSSPHRLPTLSASQALHNISSIPQRPVSTGLKGLDAVLQGKDIETTQNDLQGGVSRGEITEVYGPPGVGKTTLAMQVAANAMSTGDSVVWVDTSYRLVISRLRDIVGHMHDMSDQEQALESTTNVPKGDLDGFHHFNTPTLPHLLTLLTHPLESFPPQKTSLIVIDSISRLFALAFPKIEDIRDAQTPLKKGDAAHWASGRRWAVMGDFISKIGRLAVTKNVAILLVSQTTTRVRSDTGALLYPAISGTAWDGGINNRIVLFRDWLFRERNACSELDYQHGVRFAGIMKAKGMAFDGAGRVTAFKIEREGVREVMLDKSEIAAQVSPPLPEVSLKRKRDEIADSESDDGDAGSDQEFGWGADDEALHTDPVAE